MWFVICRLGLAIVNLLTEFEVSTSTHYDDRKGEQNIENGVIWDS